MVVCVLGFHRSGTSAVSGLIHNMGISMGKELLPASEDNPRGYFEDMEFFQLDVSILGRLQASWLQPPKLEDVEAVAPDYRTVVSRMFDHRSLRTGDWGWKDPRTVILWPVYWPVLREESKFRIVHVTREKDSAIASLVKREPKWEEYYESCYERYEEDLKVIVSQVIESKNYIHQIRFEELVANPELAIEELGGFLGRRFAPVTLKYAAAFIDPELVYCKGGGNEQGKENDSECDSVRTSSHK